MKKLLGVAESNAADAVTKAYVDALALTATPTGSIVPTAAPVVPSGWLLCYGQAVSRTTYATLFAALIINLGTATMTIAAPGVVTKTAHGLRTGDQVYFTTTGALPTGVTANTIYYANVIDANTFRLSTTSANSYTAVYITTTGTQSGTHTLVYCPWGLGDGSTTFNVPDLRGNVIAGKDDMGGTAANRLNLLATQGLRGYNLNNSGGEQAHTLTTAELASHSHSNINAGGTPVGLKNGATGSGNYGVAYAATTALDASIGTNTTGSDTTHNNVQPTIILNYIIKT